MTPAEREHYDEVEAFIAGFPYPIGGSTFVRPMRLWGLDGFQYFDDSFPYWIFYDVDEHEILVRLVSRAATSRTPL